MLIPLDINKFGNKHKNRKNKYLFKYFFYQISQTLHNIPEMVYSIVNRIYMDTYIPMLQYCLILIAIYTNATLYYIET